MSEKCLIMTSLAILVCHPSSTIRCFKPKREKPPSRDNNNHENLKPHETTTLDSHAKGVFSFPRFKKIKAPFELLEELVEGQASLRMVEAIFRYGWKHSVGYKVQKVFRVNHGKEAVKRFEEYREIVKSRSLVGDGGNEVLGYRGTTVACSLGFHQFSTTCNKRSCGVCRIIGYNNASKPVTLSKTCWRAHRRVEKCGGRRDDRRAILVCRVIAGRVGSRCSGSPVDDNFDSLEYLDASEKLMALDSRAILPSFMILYNIL